jgi:hypothetical protein
VREGEQRRGVGRIVLAVGIDLERMRVALRSSFCETGEHGGALALVAIQSYQFYVVRMCSREGVECCPRFGAAAIVHEDDEQMLGNKSPDQSLQFAVVVVNRNQGAGMRGHGVPPEPKSSLPLPANSPAMLRR